MLTNNIIFIISGGDTSKPLGISFRPFANHVRDIKHHKLVYFMVSNPNRWVHLPLNNNYGFYNIKQRLRQFLPPVILSLGRHRNNPHDKHRNMLDKC